MNEAEEEPYMQFVEEDCVSGGVAAGFRRLPELFLCWISVHGTQLEKAICGKEHKVKENVKSQTKVIPSMLASTDLWLWEVILKGLGDLINRL